MSSRFVTNCFLYRVAVVLAAFWGILPTLLIHHFWWPLLSSCTVARDALVVTARAASTLVHYSCTRSARTASVTVRERTQASDNTAKLEQTVQYPPPTQWTGTERQPPPWTDELAEMSRHIYTRHGIGDGVQKPIFQVGTLEKVLMRCESAP